MITPNASFTFTRNDSQESAKACIKRMNASKEMSRADFVALVGKDALTQLESNLGRYAHSFYSATDDNGKNIVYADVHAIHYIFTESQPSH